MVTLPSPWRAIGRSAVAALRDRCPPLACDRGAATLAAVCLCGVLAVGIVVAGQLAAAAVLVQRTNAAADLTALAAAAALLELAEEPCLHSQSIAGRNAVVLVSCTTSYPAAGPEVVVVVRSNGRVWPLPAAQASSRAGLRPHDP